MKRLLISVLIVIAVLTVSVIPVLAITRGNNGGSCQASDCTKKQCNCGESFTYEDGDGVCDNKNTQCNRGEGFADEDGDGTPDTFVALFECEGAYWDIRISATKADSSSLFIAVLFSITFPIWN